MKENNKVEEEKEEVIEQVETKTDGNQLPDLGEPI